ncbi:MAG: type I restriction endonuclease subunit M, partial [Candidatus Electrothrix sp. ATG1]|nr:type I restriction endonuclease subunit M [Candidatus Electrothrix sp. ATG1]
AELDKVNKGAVTRRLKEIKGGAEPEEEQVLRQWLELEKQRAALNKTIKEEEKALDQQAYEKYPELRVEEIKTLVVEDKWLAALDSAVHGEIDRISQGLTGRVKELAERYQVPVSALSERVFGLEERVNGHLARMGFA